MNKSSKNQANIPKFKCTYNHCDIDLQQNKIKQMKHQMQREISSTTVTKQQT